MILGSHPSVVEPMEIIQTEEGKNVLVAYSLGNYISTLKYANADVELILNIQIAKSSDSDIWKNLHKIMQMEIQAEFQEKLMTVLYQN